MYSEVGKLLIGAHNSFGRRFDSAALDVFRHLTNSSINKDAKKVLQQEEEREFRQSIYPVLGYDPSICKRSLTQLFANFKQQGVDYNQIWNQLSDCVSISMCWRD